MTRRRLSLVLALMAFSSPLPAIPITWTLQDAAFSDGGLITGSFVYDAGLNAVSAWSISVSGGDEATFPLFTYDLSDSTAAFMTQGGYTFLLLDGPPEFTFGDRDRQIRMGFLAPLTDFGGMIDFDPANIYAGECYNCNPVRTFTAGSATAVGVPEPDTIGAALAGLVLLGILGLRQRAPRAPDAR